jgi:hypothetical protein
LTANNKHREGLEMAGDDKNKDIEMTKKNQGNKLAEKKAAEIREAENKRQQAILEAVNRMRTATNASLISNIEVLNITPIKVSDKDQSDDPNKEDGPSPSIEPEDKSNGSYKYVITLPNDNDTEESTHQEGQKINVTTNEKGVITEVHPIIKYSKDNEEQYIEAHTKAMNMIDGNVILRRTKPIGIDEAKALLKAYKATESYQKMKAERSVDEPYFEKDCTDMFFKHTEIKDEEEIINNKFQNGNMEEKSLMDFLEKNEEENLEQQKESPSLTF